MKTKLEDFLDSIDIQVQNIELFHQAFVHSSFANEQKNQMSYQRLEFLGDSVLGKLSAEFIFKNYPDFSEGDMTIIKNNSVDGKSLAKHAKKLHFEKLIKVGKNNDNLRENEKILEDIFEAFIGALFLDQGENAVKKFLKNNVFKFILSSKGQDLKNPKTLLQEYLQAESRAIIEYKTFQKNDIFIAKVFHDHNIFGIGEGKTKKEAEVNAAKNALTLLGGS